MRFARRPLVLAAALIAMITVSASSAHPPSGGPNVIRLVTGLEGASGSTVGPDGALYVTEGAAGRISRIDPKTGHITTFASGLPRRVVSLPFGAAMDVAFIDKIAYVLVTSFGGSNVVGIYRVDGPDSFTVIADIGQFAAQNPPETPFQVPTGVQYALEPYRGGFLVTDGHHNRVLRVTLDGEVTEVIAFGNIVPTGLAVWGKTVYMAEAGPAPHLPEVGKVVAFKPGGFSPHVHPCQGANAHCLGAKLPAATVVASGAPLLVDVEFGPGRKLFALSQGDWDGVFPGSPALPETGALVKVKRDGSFTSIIDGLDRPTSLEFIGKTAYVVTLAGDIWKIDDVWR